MRFLLPIALAACGSASSPPRPIAHRETAAPSACLPPRFRDAGFTGAFSGRDGRGKLCLELGYEDHACLLIDGGGRVVADAPWVPHNPADWEDEHTIKREGGGYTVCARRTKQCASFRASHPASEAMAESSVVSDDGTLAFILHNHPTPKGQGRNEITGELYEIASGRVLGSVKLTTILGDHGFSDDGMTRAVKILGPRAVIVGAYPAGPGGTTALVDPGTGKGIPLHGFGGDHLAVDGRTLLVLDEADPGCCESSPIQLSIVDMTTLRITEKLAIPGRTFEEPERNAMSMVKLGGTVVIAYARPAGLVLFDLATRRLSAPRELPRCPG